MKAHTLDLDPRVGFENMRSLAAIRDDGDAGAGPGGAPRAAHSPDMVKAKYARAAAAEGSARGAAGASARASRGRIERLQKQAEGDRKAASRRSERSE